MIIVVFVVLGLAFGSFVNALVWRLRQQDMGKKLSKQKKRELSMLHGRSMCPHCRHELAWYDLVPVVSWVSLRGKCRYCRRKIEDSPLVEVAMAALFVASYLAWPLSFDIAGWVLFGFWLVFVVGFVALAVYDLRWMELPNRIVYPLIGLVLVQFTFRMATQEDIAHIFIQALAGFLMIGGLFYLLFQLSGGRWIGGGDVKLGFVIGPLVGGPIASLFVIFIASLLGTIVAVPLLMRSSLKTNSRIPFGPFLLLATVIVYLFGGRIVDWYVGSFF